MRNGKKLDSDVIESKRAASWSDKRLLVQAVIAGYRTCKQLSRMVAVSPDPQAHNPRWTPQACHFIADVERAVTAALDKRPNDRSELLQSYKRLLMRTKTFTASDRTLVSLLGSEFDRRALSPAKYFRPVKPHSLVRKAAA